MDAKPTTTDIRPFRVGFSDEDLNELRRRIAATRWPSRELVTDRSQGVQLEAILEVARYWTSDYDMRRCSARLNTLPQFKTEIDGVDVHFIHVESAHENALPLIMTHGWPGSVVELLETIGPLDRPDEARRTAPRTRSTSCCLPSPATASRANRPNSAGARIRIGRAWDELMRRLGYARYVAQGGDVGSQVTDAMGRLGLDGLIGIHTNLLTPALGDAEALSGSPPSSEEQARARRAGNIPHDRNGLLRGAGDTPRDDRLCALGFTHRPGRLDARPRYRRLLQDRPRFCRWEALGQSHPGQPP